MNQLYNYQKEGVKHLLSNPFGLPHALLADSPGTGKTPMSIEAAKAAGCTSGIILCPAIIKEQWRVQAVKWNLCLPDEIQVVYGLDAELDSTPWKILNYDIIRDSRIKQQLVDRKWHVLMMDEAQRLKTHDSQQTHAVFHKDHGIGNSCYYKWALSGTIMPNRPVELYPILATMAPAVLTRYLSYNSYIQRYCGGIASIGKGSSNISELTERLQPFMLRRELKDVWRECPPIIENVVWLDVPFEDHPDWIGEEFQEPATSRRLVAEAKIPHSADYIKDRLQSGIDKIVVFSYHRMVIEKFAERLKQFHPVKIYGGVSAKDRGKALLKFQTDPKCQIFLVQIVSGGEGLDGLQEVCNEIVMTEPEWSPGREDQAIHRVLRLGQTKPVILTKLLAARSVETNIYHENNRKRKVIDVVLTPNGKENYHMARKSTSSTADVATKLGDAILAAAEAFIEAYAGGNESTPAVNAAPPAANLPTAVPPVVAASLPATPPAPPPSVPALPPSPPIAANTPQSFEDEVLEIQKPKGKPGFDRVQQLLAHYGVTGLGQVPPANQAEFIAYL